MFLQASKMVKIAQLNKGKRVKLSKADIVDFSINLLDTKRRVSKEKYEKILRLHNEFSKDKEKIEMDLNKYQSIINDMMKEFNDIENG